MAAAKFLIDENVDFPVVLHLRQKGYDVTSIVELHPSLEDFLIMKMAFAQNRIIVTSDKDFGQLIFQNKLKSCGLILFRLGDQSSQAKIKVLDLLLDNYLDKLTGNFIVLSENKIRVRKL